MKLAEFHYDLPSSLVAQEPVTPRDRSRLMVLKRSSPDIEHRHFSDICEFLRPGDVLVINSTKVFPARLKGRKKTGGKVEVLFLTPSSLVGEGWDGGGQPLTTLTSDPPPRSSPTREEEVRWKVLVRGTTKAADLVFPEGLVAKMVERLSEGEWVLSFSSNHLRQYLDRHGEMPLPPYIKRPSPKKTDLDRYQTVYAQTEGAVAAPTAGFHFTPELLAQLRSKGIGIQSIILHVGWGTFRPVRADSIEDHQMLPETYDVSQDAAEALNLARRQGGRVIAVGTTAVRTLETICDSDGTFRPGRGETNIFIYPGYPFKGVDALITNFHLPDSTPLLLACAYYGEGRVRSPFSLRFAYEEAIRQNYRFYSYGDAMFIQ